MKHTINATWLAIPHCVQTAFLISIGVDPSCTSKVGWFDLVAHPKSQTITNLWMILHPKPIHEIIYKGWSH